MSLGTTNQHQQPQRCAAAALQFLLANGWVEAGTFKLYQPDCGASARLGCVVEPLICVRVVVDDVRGSGLLAVGARLRKRRHR